MFLLFFLVSSMITLSSAAPLDGGGIIIGSDEPGITVKGPSSKTTVKGPSGPLISTEGDTGSVSASRKEAGAVQFTGDSPGVITQSNPTAPEIPAVPVVVETVVPVKLSPEEGVVYIGASDPTEYQDFFPEIFSNTTALH
ncbi:hypothetical protein GWI33_014961 [Rhynchophorus ferrugineus]|uniref:Uncharacterized protein n=2 Tax=Rhynchophorus ferrugineus TaxID=354439 RepID=A0A834MBV6_RHYFE|nr:hypothetical protein GWI33_014961 [Rhynchophorus ferrugineus]